MRHPIIGPWIEPREFGAIDAAGGEQGDSSITTCKGLTHLHDLESVCLLSRHTDIGEVEKLHSAYQSNTNQGALFCPTGAHLENLCQDGSPSVCKPSSSGAT